jgi:hypothetical protein
MVSNIEDHTHLRFAFQNCRVAQLGQVNARRAPPRRRKNDESTSSGTCSVRRQIMAPPAAGWCTVGKTYSRAKGFEK